MATTVQRGTGTLASGQTSTDVTISSVTTSKAFAVCTFRTGSNNPNQAQISYKLLNSTTLRIERNASGSTVEFAWQVIEFGDHVRVEHSTYQSTGAVNSEIVPLADNSFDLTKSFIIASVRAAGSTWNADHFWRWKLLLDGDTNSIQFDTENSPDANTFIEYQVIEYNHASVQRGEISSSGETSLSDSLAAITPGSAFPLISWSYTPSDSTNVDEYMLSSEITDEYTITVTKNSSGGSGTINWEVVEFMGSTTTQNAVENIAGLTSGTTATLSSVDTSNTIVLSTGYCLRGGTAAYSDDDIAGEAWFTFDLQNSTQLVLTRTAVANNSDIHWYAIEFAEASSSSSISSSSLSSSSSFSSSSSLSSSSSSGSSSSSSQSSSSSLSSSSSSKSSSSSSSKSSSSSSSSSSQSSSSSGSSSSSSKSSSSSSSGAGERPPYQPDAPPVPDATRRKIFNVDFLADATVLDASEYSHVENRPHIATEWNITWTKIQQEAGNMPLNIVTNSDGPTRDFENACCGDLNTLEINLPLNKTFLKFRVRFQASNLLWSEWSEYTEFVTRNKDYKRAGNNPARDGVTFTDRGATVQGN